MSFDHSAQAAKRIIWQYRNSPKFKEWIDVSPAIGQAEIESQTVLIRDVLDLENVGGWRLDVIGSIVGQPRDSELLTDDQVYRIVIRSRIARNNTTATIDGIREAVEFVTQDAVLEVEDGQDMSFAISFDAPLDPFIRDVILSIDILPRPQGVRFTGFIEPEVLPFFGFSEGEEGEILPNVDGFGEITYSETVLEVDGGALEIDGTSIYATLELTEPAEGGHLAELFEVEL